MKAPRGKAIVRFAPRPKRDVLLPERSEPESIEAEMVDDSGGEFVQGERVVVSRMDGTYWDDTRQLCTISRDAIRFVRRNGKLHPARGYVLVTLEKKEQSWLPTPEDEVHSLADFGVVLMVGADVPDVEVGHTVYFAPASAQRVRINGTERLLLRAEQLYAFTP